jgi:Copper type II ascorbate-dependent monooxygenase, C-terminal domain
MRIPTNVATMVAGLITLASAGCGSGSSKASATTSPQQDAAPSAPEVGAGKTFQELLAYDWMIDPGVEAYYCVYKTLTEDLWVSDYRPMLSPGTHHVTIGYSDPGPPDGAVSSADTPSCSGVTLGTNLAFVATRGTDAFSMPAGVGVRIAAGKQLLLSVHVLNATQQPLNGRTGIEVVHADPTHIQHEAEIIFANNLGISIPPGPSTQTGKCTLDADSTIFSIVGHMHLTGTHFTTTALPAGGTPQKLLDENYAFDSQKFVPLEPPVLLNKGDQIQTVCTYQNPGPDTLSFGESTVKNEMCISIFYRYPAVSTNFNCAN